LEEKGNSLCRRTLFVTGDAQSTDKQEFLQKHNLACLTKPFRIDDLLQAVRKLLRNGGTEAEGQTAAGVDSAGENG
jgi:DNA-binding response OmpR family regulator